HKLAGCDFSRTDSFLLESLSSVGPGQRFQGGSTSAVSAGRGGASPAIGLPASWAEFGLSSRYVRCNLLRRDGRRSQERGNGPVALANGTLTKKGIKDRLLEKLGSCFRFDAFAMQKDDRPNAAKHGLILQTSRLRQET